MGTELSSSKEGKPKPKDGDPRKCTHLSDTICTFIKPWVTYPIFLFLFKFFFKLPNLPLEALDVLGELCDGLGLLAIATTTSRRASWPAMVTDKEHFQQGASVNTDF